MTDIAQRFISDRDQSNFIERVPNLVSMEDQAKYQLARHSAPQDRPASECLANGGKHLPELQLDCLKDLHDKNSNKAPDEVRRFEHEASRQAQDAINNTINEYRAKVDKMVEHQLVDASETMVAKIVAGAAAGKDSVEVYKLPDIDQKQMQIQVYDRNRPREWRVDSPLPIVEFDKWGNCSSNEYYARTTPIWSKDVECKRQIALQSGDSETLNSIEGEISPRFVRELRPAEQKLWDDLSTKGLQPFFVERGDESKHIYVRLP